MIVDGVGCVVYCVTQLAAQKLGNGMGATVSCSNLQEGKWMSTYQVESIASNMHKYAPMSTGKDLTR